MSWLSFKMTVKKIWAWTRAHWQIPFLVAWSLLIWILTRKNVEAMTEVMDARHRSYEKQLEILRTTHNDEILKRDNLIKEYQDSLDKIELKYKEKKKDLSEVQKNDIKEVVIKSKGNPDEIKKRIQEEFGFNLVE